MTDKQAINTKSVSLKSAALLASESGSSCKPCTPSCTLGLEVRQQSCTMQAKSDEVSHVQATWEQHENSMIDAQIKMADMQGITEAAMKSKAEALAARAAAEATLAQQNDALDRLRSRVAGVEAEADGLRSQVRLKAKEC